MRHVFNFSPGPAMLPEEVLLQAQAEMLDYRKTGMSIMEVSHRGAEFEALMGECEQNLRELMAIPKNYRVFYVAGGGSTQFSMVPINLMGESRKADYVDTGVWSKKAIIEANRFGKANVVAEAVHHDGVIRIPSQETWKLDPDAAYLHYTPNETVDGLEFHWIPVTGQVPLVADMTSMILSRPMNVSDFGIIYAGAQKNIGQAGLTVVIIHEDLIQEPLPGMPLLSIYNTYAEHKSLYNTPPTYSWYIHGLMLSWMKKQGGVEKIGERNHRKAKKLYAAIDRFPGFYMNPVRVEDRSIMNVIFNLKTEELTSLFLAEAEKKGLKNLRGHRLKGGIRASIYNAMPEAGIDALVDFMVDFIARFG